MAEANPAPNQKHLKDSEPQNPEVIVDPDFPPAEIKNAEEAERKEFRKRERR